MEAITTDTARTRIMAITSTIIIGAMDGMIIVMMNDDDQSHRPRNMTMPSSPSSCDSFRQSGLCSGPMAGAGLRR